MYADLKKIGFIYTIQSFMIQFSGVLKIELKVLSLEFNHS
jgi:hypothetical protein